MIILRLVTEKTQGKKKKKRKNIRRTTKWLELKTRQDEKPTEKNYGEFSGYPVHEPSLFYSKLCFFNVCFSLCFLVNQTGNERV